MNKWDGRTDYRRLEEAKETAGRMMHMHYCENDVEGIVSLFAPDILWMGAGEDCGPGSVREGVCADERQHPAVQYMG